MSIDRSFFAGCTAVALGALLSSSCAGDDGLVARGIGVRASPLEQACSTVSADITADVVSILSSIETLDPSQPQAYGSELCTGFVFEFDNPDEESLRGAWIQASASAGVLESSECQGRVLEADYWGFKKREWSKLASSSSAANFEPTTGACNLDALIEHAGIFEKLRIIARVENGSETYPMYACVW